MNLDRDALALEAMKQVTVRTHSTMQAEAIARTAYAIADAMIAEHHKSPSAGTLTLGVGDGTGKLYVHGDSDSIRACQRKLLRLEQAEQFLREVIKADEEGFGPAVGRIERFLDGS